MAEWSNAAVLKTVVRLSVDRGFESLFLRQTHQISPAASAAGFLFLKIPNQTCLSEGFEKTKNRVAETDLMSLKLLPQGSRAKRVIPIYPESE